jgi:uncharacterized membrane protein YqjE
MLGKSTLKILTQRFELVTLDVEEEVLRLGWLLVTAMIVAVTTGLALLFCGGAIVIYFWDIARWPAILTLCAIFVALTIILVLRLNQALAEKPRFMASTLTELEKDAAEEGLPQHG